MKRVQFQANDLPEDVELIKASIISNKPGRRSNPIPTGPEEEEEPVKPGKNDPAKKKRKKNVYEVTY